MDTKRGFTPIKSGFTLAEVLITIAIIALLFIIAVWNWRNQIGRGYDARRKSDLARIKIAFEDYYNDKNCYPPDDVLTICGGPALAPYMREIPCDPTKRTPYAYIPLAPDGCNGYRVLAALQDSSDPDIGKVGCSVSEGCGYGPQYNYGISSGAPVLGSGPPIGEPPTPTPTTQAGPPPTGSPPGWACAPDGTCNYYADPASKGCLVTGQSCSDIDCSILANRCAL